MAELHKLDDNEHYKICNLKEGEVRDCPDGLASFQAIDGNTIKVIIKKGRIVTKN